jgi:hypothetical protein
MRLIDADALIDVLHFWFRDGFDEDKWWNSTHVLAAIEGLPSAQQGYKWETCFECPLSHGCPKIKGCTNEQAIEYASQIPNDCPLSTQPDHNADIGKKVEGDCISRQAAIDAMKDTLDPHIVQFVKSKMAIEALPSVQPERERGKWIVWGGMDIPENHGRHICSLCREFAPVRYEKPLIKECLSDFCPSCGANMRGGGTE